MSSKKPFNKAVADCIWCYFKVTVDKSASHAKFGRDHRWPWQSCPLWNEGREAYQVSWEKNASEEMGIMKVDKQLKTLCEGSKETRRWSEILKKSVFHPAGDPRVYLNEDRNELSGERITGWLRSQGRYNYRRKDFGKVKDTGIQTKSRRIEWGNTVSIEMGGEEKRVDTDRWFWHWNEEGFLSSSIFSMLVIKSRTYSHVQEKQTNQHLVWPHHSHKHMTVWEWARKKEAPSIQRNQREEMWSPL